MVMPRQVHRGATAVGSISPPEPPASSASAPRWRGGWLPAADLPLDEERAATISFDRRGRSRLTVALDRPATGAVVAPRAGAAALQARRHRVEGGDPGHSPEGPAGAVWLAAPQAPGA